ncbi:MAG: RluA family pseudouridine synthase [Prolixibacteraceae bacterium]
MHSKKSGSLQNKSSKQNSLSFTVTENSLLMDFLKTQMPHKSRNNIKSLLSHKQVLVEGKPVSQFNFPLSPGQKVEISSNRILPEQKFREYSIVYEDHHLIVIDKMAGLLSMATENEKRNTAYSLLSKHVKKQERGNKIFIVHRLDRETSGLMLFAKSEPVKIKLQEFWNETVLERTYIAVVEGMVEKQEGTISSYLSEDKVFKMHSSQTPKDGKKAVTHFSVLKKNKGYSLLKVNLETGRKNQIRIHMKEMGHPIAGDKKYGATTNPMKRLGLHAMKIAFIHPVNGEKMNFETKIPRAFRRLF